MSMKRFVSSRSETKWLEVLLQLNGILISAVNCGDNLQGSLVADNTDQVQALLIIEKIWRSGD